MNLLYILERPIQNDLPYHLIQKVNGINARVICFSLHHGSLNSNENINQTVFKSNSLFTFQYELVKSLGVLIKAIRWSTTTIVYGHYHPMFKWAIFLSKIFNKNLVLTSDATSEQGIAGSNGMILKFKPFAFRTLYNSIADALFVPSNASLQFFTTIGIEPKNIVLTPYSVNEIILHSLYDQANLTRLQSFYQLPDQARIILFCGKFINRKRPQDLLEALAKIGNSSTYLIMIGDGPMRQELAVLSEQLNIQENVLFPGLIDYTDLPNYYKFANVLVVPSEHEPYGLTVNEAMICGLPVIASNAVGAAVDLIEEGITGFTYPVGDIAELTKKIKAILDNPSLKDTVTTNAQLKMQHWSSQSNADAQVQFFKQKGWLS